MNKWYDPTKVLPSTAEGERCVTDEALGSVRVPVEVILSDGTQEIVQFRRHLEDDGREVEPGGTFCGFKGTLKWKSDPSMYDFGEYWTEWIVYGATYYQPTVSRRTVRRWRYVQNEKGE